jgi:DNA topoisomerase-2
MSKATDYDKMTPIEHILARPDTYIGSVKQTTQVMDVWDSEEKIIKSKVISYTPGFLKIFDEMLVNARDASENDKTCNTINIWYNKEEGYIRIYNNGDKGIPVEEHPKHKTLVPSMIFGELLTSSNYDDTKKRTTGGKNGLGGKCLGNYVSVPLWNGGFKLAKDITIDDKLIGDDGNIRNIISIIKGSGQMYEVSQAQGESYQVNDQHILTLHMPDHKVIFWNTTKCGWSVLWWNNQNKSINTKYFSACTPQIICPECNQKLHSHLERHYKRKHKGIEVPKNIRKSPTIKLNTDNETDEIKKAFNECVDFCETINDNNVFDISIQDYMKLNNTTKLRLAGVRGQCINWPKKEVELDPYILGLWLGDGCHDGYSYACYGEKDPEIIEYLENWGKENDATIKKTNKYAYGFSSTNNKGKLGCAPLKKQLAEYNLIKNKHIPEDYLINDRDTRLKVLAGIIDTDGTVSRNGTRINITQGMNHEILSYQIVYLARSLGFNCQYSIKNTTWTWKGEKKQGKAVSINISGNGVEDIPTLLPRKKCAKPVSHNTSKSTGFITIKDIGINEYVGIHIDGNERFLINDFTVTHNCANIYSSSFTVEVGDSERSKKFVQEWTNNMLKTSGPKVTKYSKKTSYVDIKFYPEVNRFGLDSLDDDHNMLFYRRAIDLAGVSSEKIKVSFNDEKINVTNFKQYIQLYYPSNSNSSSMNNEIYYDESEDGRWKVGVLYIQESNNKVVSFVNSIATYKGGSHVNHVADKIIKQLVDNHIKKKNKDVRISPSILKENLVFFVNAVIENPSFDSQTKETLTTEPKEFGSKYDPSENFIKKLAKCGIVEQVLDYAKFKESKDLKKNDGKKQKTIHGIPKLEDANEAGGKNSSKCSLILTEGDSAKTFAVAGLSIIGRDYFGVFPLKGKMLNVREASTKQLTENEEISNLKKILGLRQGAKYNTDEDFSTLRYGRIICLTDADVDGSHIKGLVMNMFHCIWPELVQREGFITSMATPIVKAFKGKDTKVFYNLTEYEEWVSTNPTGWKIKYYKGLGTSTAAEAKEYFVDIEDKLINYMWEEMAECEDALTLAFQKNRADDRKEWLMKYDRNDILTYEEKSVGYDDFIHKDLKHFSNYDCSRSIPHIMDGLKPSQRKILYGAYLRGLDKDEVKVAQLSGFVSDKAAYHHGEMSLNGAIVGMAQDFVGSNNINILAPLGQLGTRLLGGKDAASPRYIFTKITDISSLIFRKSDNNILNNQEEDGMDIEPEYYAPIIPMVLVNGASGIGTGFSTDIPCYNPIDIIDNLIKFINADGYNEMDPFWRGFTGTVEKVSDNAYETKGIYSIKKNKLIITELPIGSWTQNYKEYLEKLFELEQTKKSKEDKSIIGYKEYHSDTTVHFEIDFVDGYLEKAKDIYKTFHLISRISINNMHLYSVDGCITKYNTIRDIMEEYYKERLVLYAKRREYQLNELKNELDIISNKARFILMVVNDELIVNKRKRIDIEKDLIDNDFPKLGTNKNFDYLLNMQIYQLTYEKIEELKKQEKQKESEYNTLNKMKPEDIWKHELEELKEAIVKQNSKITKDNKDNKETKVKSKKK